MKFKEFFYEKVEEKTDQASDDEKTKKDIEKETEEIQKPSIEDIKIQQTINQTQRLIQYVETGLIYRKWNELTDIEKMYLVNLYGAKTMLSKKPAFYLFCNIDDGTRNKIIEIYGNSIVKEGVDNV